ncbi:retroviral-like aspartic protease family protein [Nitrospirillum iridis]|uniref:Putative aspartyl protease n=1 Tax=Nitrospirillum iridis TaxID=765888 RepID=A0A7X0EES5_9PROT|nr:retroviral-like aspartic protease family protein [Nitrospirillum iridis]MBB6252361.1 putative aspartyl protease [Nitrospirillum iridis]
MARTVAWKHGADFVSDLLAGGAVRRGDRRRFPAFVVWAALWAAGAVVAAVPAQAGQDACHLYKLGSLPLTLDGNQPLIDATINGQPVHLLMDTGAAISFLTRPAVERLNLRHHWEPGLYMGGVGGSHLKVNMTKVDDLTLGEWTVHNIPFLVAGAHDVGETDVAGTIGESFFRNYDVDIDIAHKVVNLFRTDGCDGQDLAYWGGNFTDAKIGMSEDGNPQIWVTVQVNGVDVRAILDSGAETSVMTMRAAARAGITPESPGVTRAGASQGIGETVISDYVAVFPTFTVGEETIRNVRLRFGDLFEGDRRMSTPEMLLGLDFLRAHRVMVAHSQRKIYLSYVGGPVFQVVGPRLRRADPLPDGAAEDADGPAAKPADSTTVGPEARPHG